MQMPRDDEIRLAMGELSADQMRTAKAAIRWMLTRAATAQAVRDAALEEAALRCESFARTGREMSFANAKRAAEYHLQSMAAQSCAAAIRALKSQKEGRG